MTNGECVVMTALQYEGVVEIPSGSNDDRGGPITRWQQRSGLYTLPAERKPYCGTALDAWFAEAGIDDSNVCSPSTAVMCERADNLGGLAPSGSLAPIGSIICKCGVHTGLVVRDRGNGLLDTIEANVSHSVKRLVRVKADWRIIVVPAVAKDAQAVRPPLVVTSYGFDDLSLKPTLYGGWSTPAARDEQLARYKAAHPRDWTRAVRTSAASPYAFEAGPGGTYGADWRFGGWPNKAIRDEKVARYEESRPGARVRIWSKSVPVPDTNGSPTGEGESLT